MNGLHGHPHGGELHAEEKFLAELCAAAAVPAKPVFLERNVVTVVMNNVAMAAHHHHQQQQQQQQQAVFRIHVFFGLPDSDPLVRSMDPDPALNPDPSIIMQK